MGIVSTQIQLFHDKTMEACILLSPSVSSTLLCEHFTSALIFTLLYIPLASGWPNEKHCEQLEGEKRVKLGHVFPCSLPRVIIFGWLCPLTEGMSSMGEGNGIPLQCSCLENPRDRGAWWAAVYGVAQSQTRLT